MTNILIVLVVIFFISCQQKNKTPSLSTLNLNNHFKVQLELKKELNRDSNPLLKNISTDFFYVYESLLSPTLKSFLLNCIIFTI
jgi:hypothetical protein